MRSFELPGSQSGHFWRLPGKEGALGYKSGLGVLMFFFVFFLFLVVFGK